MLLPSRKIRLLTLTVLVGLVLLALVGCTTPPAAEVASVAITGGDREVSVDETVKLAVEVIVQGEAESSVTWTSSNESAATINQDGELKALAVGTSTITATSVFSTNLRNLYLGKNCLDVSDNSPARSIITTLETSGTNMNYDPQRDCES